MEFYGNFPNICFVKNRKNVPKTIDLAKILLTNPAVIEWAELSDIIIETPEWGISLKKVLNTGCKIEMQQDLW